MQFPQDIAWKCNVRSATKSCPFLHRVAKYASSLRLPLSTTELGWIVPLFKKGYSRSQLPAKHGQILEGRPISQNPLVDLDWRSTLFNWLVHELMIKDDFLTAPLKTVETLRCQVLKHVAWPTTSQPLRRVGLNDSDTLPRHLLFLAQTSFSLWSKMRGKSEVALFAQAGRDNQDSGMSRFHK